MLCLKLCSALVVILCLMPEQALVASSRSPRSRKVLNCTNSVQPAFIWDTKNCFVFRNECYMRKNLFKYVRPLKFELYRVDKAFCQTQCNHDCDGVKISPVCGSTVGNFSLTLFNNECELMKRACVIGQPITKSRFCAFFSNAQFSEL